MSPSGCLAAVAIVLAGCVHTEPFRDAAGSELPGSIARMEMLAINGLPQSLWLRGADTRKPALVIVHGGPGVSESALLRHYNAELEHHFLVVYWEQRGTGRSWRADIPAQSMTIAQFVRDLDEVVEHVRKRFGKDKVALLAHSWGTVPGTIYAAGHPDKVAAYVGVAQVADMPRGQQLEYEFALAAARRRADAAALSGLHALGEPPHTVDQTLALGRWTEAFGGVFHGGLSTGRLILAALSTDEAGLLDLVRFGRGNRFSLDHLWPEFSRVDLSRRYTEFEVPMFFFLGRHDRHVPSVLAARWFDRIRAPAKQLVWFERSAHNPPFEEPAAFNRALIGALWASRWSR